MIKTSGRSETDRCRAMCFSSIARGVAPNEPWFKGVNVGEKEKWDLRKEVPKGGACVMLKTCSCVGKELHGYNLSMIVKIRKSRRIVRLLTA